MQIFFQRNVPVAELLRLRLPLPALARPQQTPASVTLDYSTYQLTLFLNRSKRNRFRRLPVRNRVNLKVLEYLWRRHLLLERQHGQMRQGEPLRRILEFKFSTFPTSKETQIKITIILIDRLNVIQS